MHHLVNVLSVTLFQSTHPRGVRRIDGIELGIDGTFQSTHPRGVRLEERLLELLLHLFQSTHPRGVRPLGLETTSLR